MQGLCESQKVRSHSVSAFFPLLHTVHAAFTAHGVPSQTHLCPCPQAKRASCLRSSRLHPRVRFATMPLPSACLSTASSVLRAAATQIRRPFPACSKRRLNACFALFGLQSFRLFYPFYYHRTAPAFSLKHILFSTVEGSRTLRILEHRLGNGQTLAAKLNHQRHICALSGVFLRRFPVSRHTVFHRTSGAVRRLYRASYRFVLSRNWQVGVQGVGHRHLPRKRNCTALIKQTVKHTNPQKRFGGSVGLFLFPKCFANERFAHPSLKDPVLQLSSSEIASQDCRHWLRAAHNR